MSGLNNYSRAIFLISDDVRGIECSYEPGPDGEPKPSSVKLFKSLDPDIIVGDFVVVPTETRWNMTVVKVAAVDVVVDVEAGESVPWILSRFDRAIVDGQIAQESQAIDQIKEAQRKKRKDELRETVLAGAGKEAAALLVAPTGKGERRPHSIGADPRSF